MRTHTTKTLKELVVDKMDPQHGEMSQHEIDIWLQAMPEITREMHEAIVFFNSFLFNRSLLFRQLAQIHRECIYLLDKIEKMPRLSPQMTELRTALVKCLEEILDKLRTDYRKYLEPGVFMPLMHLRREQEKVKERMQVLQSVFTSLGVDKKLEKLILVCMTDVCRGVRCSYERMEYVAQLQEALLDSCKQASKSSVREMLFRLLLERNYNTEQFTVYYQKAVKDDLADMPEVSDQLYYLRQLCNVLKLRMHKKSVYRYDDNRKRVQDVLEQFVMGELHIAETKARASQQAAQDAYRASHIIQGARIMERKDQGPKQDGVMGQPETAAAQVSVPYKIRTAMTVDMLAYFIKLMVKAKVIEPGVRTELFAFAAGIFQTPSTGSTGISPGSLGVKYRQVVQSTAKTVRVLVARMLKEIDEEYNGA